MNLLGSLDIDFTPTEEAEMELFAVKIPHEYESVVIEGKQTDTVTDESTTSTAERYMIRSGSPRSESSGTGAARAAIDRTAEPHAPRKLHNCTWKV